MASQPSPRPYVVPGSVDLHAPIPWSDAFRWKIYFGLAGLAILRFWVAPLRASLWLDETTTFWTASKGIAETIHRSQIAPGQSLIYSLLSAVIMRITGQSELALRLPSLFAGLGTIWLLFELGKRLLDREAALLAVVVFVSLPEIIPEIPNARPYAIALFFVVGSLLQLVRWLDTGKKRNMLAYVVLSAAIVYFHPLLSTVYMAHLAYAFVRLRTSDRVPWPNLALAAILLLVLIFPPLWYVLRVQHASSSLAFAGTPDTQALVFSLLPQTLTTSIFAGLLIAYLIWRDAGAKVVPEIDSEDFVLLLSWLIFPIISMFLLSRFTPFKVFITRYYLDSFPALALLMGWGLRSTFPARVRVLVAALVVGVVLIANGTWIGTSSHTDWRAAAESVRASGVDGNTPVLVRSGLIETAKVSWEPTSNPDSLLLSPLSKYPMLGRIILIPYRLDSEGMRYMQSISSQFLDPSQRFLLVEHQDGDFGPWLQGRLGEQFVSKRLTKDSNRIAVTIFRRR